MSFLKPINNISFWNELKSVLMVRFFYTFLFSCIVLQIFAQKTENFDGMQPKSILEIGEISKTELIISTISTGIVGGHRLLLRKKASTPIIYCVTLGGGLGFLPLVDLVTIILTKKENLYLLKHDKFFLFNHEKFIQP
jgi:hypothetical protein